MDSGRCENAPALGAGGERHGAVGGAWLFPLFNAHIYLYITVSPTATEVP